MVSAVVVPSVAHVYAQWDAANSDFATATVSGLAVAYSKSITPASGNVRANVGMSSGKWYWEVTRSATATDLVAGITDGSVNNKANSAWGYYPGNHAFRTVWRNGHGYGTWVPTVANRALPNSAGDTLGFALDMTTGTFSVYEKCSSTPYAIWSGLSGTMYPLVGSAGGALGTTVTETANFGASSFACTPPAGYNAGVW